MPFEAGGQRPLRLRPLPGLCAALLLCLTLLPRPALAGSAVPIWHRPGSGLAPYEEVDRLDAPPFSPDAPLLRIDFIGIGTGDAILIRAGGRSLLVDGGDAPRAPALRRFLAREGVEHIDLFFNSHPHNDHVQGQIALLKAGFRPQALLSAFGRDYRKEEQLALLEAMDRAAVPLITLKSGDRMEMGGAQMLFLGDERGYPGMVRNAKSTVLHLRYGEASILLTADITGRTQAYLAQQYAPLIKADIMKTPHHGYDHVRRDFLEAVAPALSISTGSKAACVRSEGQFDRLRMPRYYLPLGGITLLSDGQGWYVYQYKTDQEGYHGDQGPGEEDHGRRQG